MVESALVDNTWQQSYLLTIDAEGSDAGVEFAGKTTDTEFPEEKKDVEPITMNDGSQITKLIVPESGEIKLKVYTKDTSVFDMFGGDSSGHTFSYARKKYRLAFLWTTDSSASSGAGATTVGHEAYRKVYQNVYMIAYKHSWTDKVLELEITFKAQPFDASGNSNVYEEYTDGTSGLSALSSY